MRKPFDNINEMPSLVGSNKRESITIGDLHGNAVLMFYHLIKCGVLSGVTAQQYDDFVQAHDVLYEHLVLNPYCDAKAYCDERRISPSMLVGEINRLVQSFAVARLQVCDGDGVDRRTRVSERKKRIEKAFYVIKTIIDNAIITNEKRVLRFIGDLLADRGPCDMSILWLLKKLQAGKDNINVRILMSNHDASFMRYIPFKVNSLFLPLLQPAQESSLFSLLIALQFGFVDVNEVNEIVCRYYLPKLLLIDFSPNIFFDSNRQEMVSKFYVHAPVRAVHIERLVESMLGQAGLSWLNTFKRKPSVEQFKGIAAALNVAFQKALMGFGDFCVDWVAYFGEANKSALYDFVWARLPEHPQGDVAGFWGLSVACFHGHDGKHGENNLNISVGRATLSQAILNSFELKGFLQKASQSRVGKFWISNEEVYTVGSGIALGAAVASKSKAESVPDSGTYKGDEFGSNNLLALLLSNASGACASVNAVGAGNGLPANTGGSSPSFFNVSEEKAGEERACKNSLVNRGP